MERYQCGAWFGVINTQFFIPNGGMDVPGNRPNGGMDVPGNRQIGGMDVPGNIHNVGMDVP